MDDTECLSRCDRCRARHSGMGQAIIRTNGSASKSGPVWRPAIGLIFSALASVH